MVKCVALLAAASGRSAVDVAENILKRNANIKNSVSQKLTTLR
jgi:hypothetical protein